MKKASLVLFVFLLGISLKGFSQTPAPANDFWVGKWEFSIIGTPQGDSKMTTTLVRKDGKLTGEFPNPDPNGEKIPITNIEESADKIVIYFTTQGYDINLDLSKVDDNNLKGTLLGMFEAKGVRVK